MFIILYVLKTASIPSSSTVPRFRITHSSQEVTSLHFAGRKNYWGCPQNVNGPIEYPILLNTPSPSVASVQTIPFRQMSDWTLWRLRLVWRITFGAMCIVVAV